MPHPVPQGRGWALHSPHHVPAAAFFHPSPPPIPSSQHGGDPTHGVTRRTGALLPTWLGPPGRRSACPRHPQPPLPGPAFSSPPDSGALLPASLPTGPGLSGAASPRPVLLPRGPPTHPHAPSSDGGGMVRRMSSSWWGVDVPGNRGLPRSISPRTQPRLHMSAPGVYLGQGRGWERAGPGGGPERGEGTAGGVGRPWGLAGREGTGAPAAGGGDGIGWCQVTGWRTAAPLEPGTSEWPHTRSGPGPPAPRGGRGGGGRGRSHTASPGSRH